VPVAPSPVPVAPVQPVVVPVVAPVQTTVVAPVAPVTTVAPAPEQAPGGTTTVTSTTTSIATAIATPHSGAAGVTEASSHHLLGLAAFGAAPLAGSPI